MMKKRRKEWKIQFLRITQFIRMSKAFPQKVIKTPGIYFEIYNLY